MFKEGTLISTNQGVIPIEYLGFARKEGEESECKSNLMLKTYGGEWNKCLFQTHKKSTCIKIKFLYHFTIELTEDQKILTPSGYKLAGELKKYDEICTYRDVYVDKNTCLTDATKINYISQSGNDIYIPKKMNEELATICGILISPNTIIRLNDKDKLVITCKDRTVNKIFIRYVRDLFQTKQKMIVQDDQYCRIFSPYLIDFFDKICGLNHREQTIHQSLLQSERNIQIAFLNSLIMAGDFRHLGTINVSYLYTMVSPYVSDQIESILCLYGYSPYLKTIDRKKTICIRKPVDEFFSDRMLDKMKKNAEQSTMTIGSIVSVKKSNCFGIICEKENYAIKNLVFGV